MPKINCQPPEYTTYARLFAGRPKPFAYIDLDALNFNIRQVLAYSGDKTIRVGSKSVRCRRILRHILDSDPRFQGLLCFTAAEAVWLAQQGFDDLLVAYPTIEPQHVTAVLQQIAAGSHITLMVDSLDHVRRLDELAQAQAVDLPVCLDLDMATRHLGGRLLFGVQRSDLRTGTAVLAVAEAIRASARLHLDGVMGYEAQIAGVTDDDPGGAVMNRIKRRLKRQSIPEVAERRTAVLQALESAGFHLRFVNAGGSGSLQSSAAESRVTEVTAGSAFYCPALFSRYADYHYAPAAGFAIEVVRQPAAGVYTCLGGGYVASGQPGADRLPEPYLPAGARLSKFEGAGEVQTPILYDGPEKLGLGAPVFMRHAKAGELCERFNELILVADGRIVDTVPTYRGDGRCFL